MIGRCWLRQFSWGMIRMHEHREGGEQSDVRVSSLSGADCHLDHVHCSVVRRDSVLTAEASVTILAPFGKTVISVGGGSEGEVR